MVNYDFIWVAVATTATQKITVKVAVTATFYDNEKYIVNRCK